MPRKSSKSAKSDLPSFLVGDDLAIAAALGTYAQIPSKSASGTVWIDDLAISMHMLTSKSIGIFRRIDGDEALVGQVDANDLKGFRDVLVREIAEDLYSNVFVERDYDAAPCAVTPERKALMEAHARAALRTWSPTIDLSEIAQHMATFTGGQGDEIAVVHVDQSSTGKFTVVGIYMDNGQRWGDVIEASSAEEAEKQAPDGVSVAAVLPGDVAILR